MYFVKFHDALRETAETIKTTDYIDYTDEDPQTNHFAAFVSLCESVLGRILCLRFTRHDPGRGLPKLLGVHSLDS